MRLVGSATLALAISAVVSAAPAAATPTPVVPGVTLNSQAPASCSGGGTVFDSSGQVLDHATAPGGGGASPSNPIIVDPGGTVTYHGTSGSVITNHHWWIDFQGIQVKSGGSANNSHKTTTAGNEKVSSYIPGHLLTGTYYVNGAISGTGGGCSGAAYVKLNGNTFTTAGFWLMIVFLLLALLFFYWGMPGMAADYLDDAEAYAGGLPPGAAP